MAKYTPFIEAMLDSFMESHGTDSAGNLKVINEAAEKKTAALLSKIVLEKSVALFDDMESNSDEISFQEMNADPSSMSMDHDLPAPEEHDDQGNGDMMGADDMMPESIEDFDLAGIFEEEDDNGDEEDEGADEDLNEFVQGDEDTGGDHEDDEFADLNIGFSDDEFGNDNGEENFGDEGEDENMPMNALGDEGEDDFGGDAGDHDMVDLDKDDDGEFNFDFKLDGDEDEDDMADLPNDEEEHMDMPMEAKKPRGGKMNIVPTGKGLKTTSAKLKK